MGWCRVCGLEYKGEKWYVDNNIDLMRRSCCDGMPSNETKRQEWLDEIKEIKKRYEILKYALKSMGPPE